MNFNRFFSAGLVGACLASIALPALARPEIASGDRLLSTDFQGCLSSADRFIASLGVVSDSGEMDRTGYFEDGTFRILCYGTGTESMVIVFAAHNQSADVAASFVQLALEELFGSPSAQLIP